MVAVEWTNFMYTVLYVKSWSEIHTHVLSFTARNQFWALSGSWLYKSKVTLLSMVVFVCKYHNMKIYKGARGPCILHLCTILRYEVMFIFWWLYLQQQGQHLGSNGEVLRLKTVWFNNRDLVTCFMLYGASIFLRWKLC